MIVVRDDQQVRGVGVDEGERALVRRRVVALAGAPELVVGEQRHDRGEIPPARAAQLGHAARSIAAGGVTRLWPAPNMLHGS